MTPSNTHASSSNKKSASSLPRNVTTTSNNAPDFPLQALLFSGHRETESAWNGIGGVSFYGTMSTAKQQIASVAQAPHTYFDLSTQGSAMGGNFDRNPKGASRYALSVCVFGRNTLGSGIAAPITAATSITTTPFKGKHSISSSAAMIG